jgi:SAM-dependent methyltransferase
MALLTKIQSFIQSKTANSRWLKLLLVLLVLLILAIYRRKYAPDKHTEGFTQNDKYVMQRGADIYDEFYAGIYDYLHKTDKRCPYEMKRIVEATQPDKTNSVMLDIGCGTGCMVNTLRQAGYRAFGVDKSAAMVDASRQKYPKANVRKVDAEDSMAFDRETFTHVLCLNFTIYEFADKVAFFRNCYYWLVPGGYLVVHMANPAKFDPIVPAGKPKLLENPQKYAKERITDTSIDFADFKYKSVYDFSHLETRGEVVHTETFTDKETLHIRENERIIPFESESTIVEKALMCRFLLHAQFSARDDAAQIVYIFQKI